jgi:formylglycine-generating enzyme required for sulfatase activity
MGIMAKALRRGAAERTATIAATMSGGPIVRNFPFEFENGKTIRSSKANPRDGLTYQWIPPGSYVTGCLPGDTECYGLERRRGKIVVVTGFWIGRTEVTQAAYKRVMEAAPSYYRGANLPADRVGWTDATTYCSRIGMRLPTESEWEYAAYGGTAELPKEPLASLAWYDRKQQGHYSSRSHEAAQRL